MSQDCLFRLLESEYCDAYITIYYLFHSKSNEVREYLGNKLFELPEADVEFFLPQLIHLYITYSFVADQIHSYILCRCLNDGNFALKAVWWLKSCSKDDWMNPDAKRRVLRLLDIIISNDMKSKKSQTPTKQASPGISKLTVDSVSESLKRSASTQSLKIPSNQPQVVTTPKFVRTHSRSRSDDSGLMHFIPILRSGSNLDLFDTNLATGGAFNLDCSSCLDTSFWTCRSHVPRLTVLQNFVQSFLNICDKLGPLLTKEDKMNKLHAELCIINLNLPARVRIPTIAAKYYDVVRIPPNEGIVLNSKDRIPYIVNIEFVERQSAESPLPVRCTRSNHLTTPKAKEAEPVLTVSAASIRDSLTSQSENGVPGFSYDRSDPSASRLKEPWEQTVKRIQQFSPYGHLPGWALHSCIVKCGDDLRQEVIAYQLLRQFQEIWAEEKLDLWLRPYIVVVVNEDSGFIEVIPNTVSLHQVKKQSKLSLYAYFIQQFGSSTSESFLSAQKNFVHSLAAYSLFCYFVQVKDRHNGNILLDNDGHIIHIDYGFMLSHSPGRNIGFENSPFKLTDEHIEVLGGQDSDMFRYFKCLLLKGFLMARKHFEKVKLIVEVMQLGSQWPCFNRRAATVHDLENRFFLHLTEQQLSQQIDGMIYQALRSLTTKLYDNFQYYTGGIM